MTVQTTRWLRSDEGRDALIHCSTQLGLTDDEWGQLAGFMRGRTLAADERLFSAGDPGDALVLVVEGRLAILSRSGDWAVLEAHAGEFVGALACIDPAPRASTVVAIEPSRVALLDRNTLDVMTEHAPRIAARITNVVIQQLNDRMTALDAEIDELVGAPRSVPPPPPLQRKSIPPPRKSVPPAPKRSEETSASGEHEKVGRSEWWRALLSRVKGFE